MIRVFKIVLVLLTICLSSFGQGKKINSLKTGKWLEKHVAYYKYTLSGNYKIIPFNKYERIRSLGSNCYEVKYKGSTPLLFYDGLRNGNISVKDGIWNSYDTIGNLRRISFWIEGLNQWDKHFDEKGNLIKHDYKDYENDTSFYLTYINGRLFKKGFFPPENKNLETNIYYPENNLVISDAELNFHTNFLYNPIAPQKIIISAKKEASINSIKSKHNSILLSIDCEELAYPLIVSNDKSIVLDLKSNPEPWNYISNDTIIIQTSESNEEYLIYLKLKAAHINYKNVRELKTLILSRLKDKYLIIEPLGTVTDAILVSSNGTTSHYNITSITKIDLSNYSKGEYDLEIESCSTGGRIKLIITE